MNYTLNNHLSYTVGSRRFGFRENGLEKFVVDVGKIDKDHYRTSSWREELRRTADTVLSEYGKDVLLFLSGGTDSEIVLRNFLEIGHKPRCAIIKFYNDYNADDVNTAIKICEELDVKLDIIEFDIRDFYYSGLANEFSKEIACTQITYLMVYYHVMKLGAPSVMGGEQLLRRHVTRDGSFWYHCFRENEDASAMRFSEKFKVPLVNEWFSYTPEMMLYYLENPDVQSLVTNRYNYKITSVSSKNAILNKIYPDIELRKKTHGFEDLLGFNQEVYSKFRSNVIKRLENSIDGIEIFELIKKLKGEI